MAHCFEDENDWALKPIEIEMTAQEAEEIQQLSLNDIYVFRGREFIFMGFHSKKIEWVLADENSMYTMRKKND